MGSQSLRMLGAEVINLRDENQALRDEVESLACYRLKPIKTAPRDRRIILYSKGDSMIGWWDAVNDCWIACVILNSVRPYQFHPTHWCECPNLEKT